MSSLASLFKKISKPSPLEIDPEDSYHSIDAKINQSNDRFEETREIIQRTMGSSLLRTEIELESSEFQDPKYAARLVSVKDWTEAGERKHPIQSERSRDDGLDGKKQGPPSSQAQLSNEDRERRSEAGDSGVEEEDEQSAGEELELEEQSASGSRVEQEVRFAEHPSSDPDSSTTESSTSTSDNLDHRQRSSNLSNLSTPSVQPNPLQAAPQQEQPSDLIQQLQLSVKADIAKGKAVKQQLATYDRILAIRIGLQKSLVATNKLAGLRLDGELKHEGLEEKRQLAIENLLRLSSKLGSLREHLMESVDGQPPRKRRKDDVSDYEGGSTNKLAQSLEDAEQLDKRLSPYLRTTIRKWSSKINSTITLNSKKFDHSSSKPQNVLDYLDQVWSSKLEREKLIQRSRTIKPLAHHHRSSTVIQDRQDPHTCPSLFDDREFYLSLLKEVVETASRNQDLTEDSILQTRDYRSHRTHRENVDPKASKGRKIRYEVHDKLVSLMVPIQNELWTDEQKDELFGSLFGFGFESEPPIQAPQSSERRSTGVENDRAERSLTQGFRLI